MFDALTTRLGEVFERLRKRGALTEADVAAALREVRVALLEADVALPVVKDFIEAVQKRAVGQEVLRSVTPGQMVVKIVHDHLVEVLGGEAPPEGMGAEINLAAVPPAPLMVVGLQGSGKTTTCAKLALRLKTREKKKVLLASLDVYRPAAQQQLVVLGEQAGVPVLAPVFGEQPLAIARRAMETGRREGYDAVILDTAGRLHIDDALMAEVAAVRDAVHPAETLLVADALTGQDAVNVAREFNARVGISGIVLTRVDGDSRGGAALSMRAVTGRPIKLIGVGEKLDALEPFQAARVAGRILGMGDIVGLVEKAAETVEKEKAEALAARALKGAFTLDDMAEQLRQIKKMGSLEGLLGMLPGVAKVKKQIAEARLDDRLLARQEAIILSMTRSERRNPKLLNASRRRRIAAGSGTTVQDVNRLLKQFQQMSDMMKKVGKLGQKGLMRGLPPGFGPPVPPFR
jgi:signal recognition particle subunit SRP54